MIRLTGIAVAILIGLTSVGHAESCRQRLDDLSKKIEAVIDAKTKQQAMKEREQAQQAMAQNDEAGCMKHAETAQNMMHGD